MDVIINPKKIEDALAERCRQLRLRRNWKRATLADHAGVSEASLKRFETTGKVSLGALL